MNIAQTMQFFSILWVFPTSSVGGRARAEPPPLGAYDADLLDARREQDAETGKPRMALAGRDGHRWKWSPRETSKEHIEGIKNSTI